MSRVQTRCANIFLSCQCSILNVPCFVHQYLTCCALIQIVLVNKMGPVVTDDHPLLRLLEECSGKILVPITVSGATLFTSHDDSAQSETDAHNTREEQQEQEVHTAAAAIEAARRCFRAGADRVVVGCDEAVAAVEAFLRSGVFTGSSVIEQLVR